MLRSKMLLRLRVAAGLRNPQCKAPGRDASSYNEIRPSSGNIQVCGCVHVYVLCVYTKAQIVAGIEAVKQRV